MISIISSASGDLFLSIVRMIHDRPRLRRAMLIISSLIDLIAIPFYILIKNRVIDIYFGNGSTAGTNNTVADILLLLIIAASIVLVITICSFTNIFEKWHSQNDILDEISKRKQALEEKINAQEDKPHIQDIIQLNLSQLNEYYTINKSQSKTAYRLSLLMILIGFLLIVNAVVIGFSDPSDTSIALISGIAGLLSEFIGATALSLYKESNSHVNEFMERLSYLQKVMLAIELIDRISEDKKDAQLSVIITSLMKNDEPKEQADSRSK